MADSTEQLDIAVKDGRIAGLSPRISGGSGEEYDARGLVVMPGAIDVHVHFNEPGLSEWEGFRSGSAALAAGGCTTYFDMPLNGVPPTTRPAALQAKLQAASSQSAVDFALWAGLVPGNVGQLAALAEQGAVGFKAFMSEPGGEGEERFQAADDLTLLEGMKEIARLNRVLALHAESESLTSALAERAKREGRRGARDYSQSRPVLAELEAVSRALLFAEFTGCPLHFVHISSAEAVERIDRSRREGLNVTLETCPHYLTLTLDDLERLGPVAKCAPPLRSAAEREMLWEMLRENKIDMISSDHSPCPGFMKSSANGDLFEAWGGISGAQQTLELLFDEGHLARKIPLPQIARWLSLNPAKRFGLHPRKGEILVGADADLALVDAGLAYKLEAGHLLYRHKHSPYVGRSFRCRVKATFVRGKPVYLLDRELPPSPSGEWISPANYNNDEG